MGDPLITEPDDEPGGAIRGMTKLVTYAQLYPQEADTSTPSEPGGE
jgi:hypothetical protein